MPPQSHQHDKTIRTPPPCLENPAHLAHRSETHDNHGWTLFKHLCVSSSGLSALNFRVDGLEFEPSVVDFHSPVDATLGVVNVRWPCGDFSLQNF